MRDPTRSFPRPRRCARSAARLAAATPLLTPLAATAAAPEAGGVIGAGAGEAVRITRIFAESFDFFTVLLVLSSLVSGAVFIRCLFEVRRGRIIPATVEEDARDFAAKSRWADLRALVDDDRSLLSASLRAAIRHPGESRESLRNAGELAASEECARIFRLVEPLNILGNLGPLLGLAGTVWGMVIAFAALGQAGGEATPANLSVGISKALFHTLLGLLVALPALAGFGYFRAKADRLCNRAMIVAAELVDQLPLNAAVRAGPVKPGAPRAMGPPPLPQATPQPIPSGIPAVPAVAPSSAPGGPQRAEPPRA